MAERLKAPAIRNLALSMRFSFSLLFILGVMRGLIFMYTCLRVGGWFGLGFHERLGGFRRLDEDGRSCLGVQHCDIIEHFRGNKEKGGVGRSHTERSVLYFKRGRRDWGSTDTGDDIWVAS